MEQQSPQRLLRQTKPVPSPQLPSVLTAKDEEVVGEAEDGVEELPGLEDVR